MAIVFNPPNVLHPMETVETLIDKLKEQFDQKVGEDKLLITAQLLLAELRNAVSPLSNSDENPEASINADNVQVIEINMIDHKPHRAIPKKDDLSGWLFDKEIEIPTLIHQVKNENIELNDVMNTSKKV